MFEFRWSLFLFFAFPLFSQVILAQVDETQQVLQGHEDAVSMGVFAPDGKSAIDQLLNRMSKRFEFKVERLEQRLEVLRKGTKRSTMRPARGAMDHPSNRHGSVRPSAITDPNAALQESADGTDSDLTDGGSMVTRRQKVAGDPADASASGPVSLKPMTGLERDRTAGVPAVSGENSGLSCTVGNQGILML